MNDKDVSGFMKRDEFEQITIPVLERVKKPQGKALAEARFIVDDIYVMEVVCICTTCFCDMQEEEFCLVSGLKFGVENSTDYNKAKGPIPFSRMVFSSDLDGRPIRGKDVLLLIESDVFKKLDDNDAVSLCCVGILQLVLLGVEDRRPVPNWILRLANDRVSWDNYLWGSCVWPTLYRHLRDANVKRWQPLYASYPTNEYDTKSYSIEGFAWAFKRRGYQQMKEKNVDMYEKMTRFMEDMRRVPEANTTPIIADHHFGVSDISGFQSYQGVPSAFHTLANNSSFFNMATPSNLQTSNQSNWLSPSNWQTPNQLYLGTPNSQPPIPSQPGTSNWQNPMTSRHQDAGILDPVIMNLFTSMILYG
nr:hypothetical protein [Tanacetum cinerariifolium]